MNRTKPILVQTIKRRASEIVEPAIIPKPVSTPVRPSKLGALNAAWIGLGDRVEEIGGVKYLDGAFCTVQGLIREYNRTCLETGQEQVGPDHLRA